MFNLQGYYYNFLVIIKFINDFESTPNFKLVCIYTELKKLANNLLIPYFSKLYPDEFAKFEDVSLTSEFLQRHVKSNLRTCFFTIDTDKLEKSINNVLVYSFNDATFLNMAEQPTNEFSFDNKYPTYCPAVLSNELGSESSLNGVHTFYSQNQKPSWFDAKSGANNELHQESNESTHGNNANDESKGDDLLPTKSTLDLLLYHSNNLNGGSKKQGFSDRYHLLDKYISIAICFLKNVKEEYAHSHILDKMVNDFKRLEKCLEDERAHEVLSKLEVSGDVSGGADMDSDFHRFTSDNLSAVKMNSCLSINATDDAFSKELQMKFLQPKV